VSLSKRTGNYSEISSSSTKKLRAINNNQLLSNKKKLKLITFKVLHLKKDTTNQPMTILKKLMILILKCVTFYKLSKKKQELTCKKMKMNLRKKRKRREIKKRKN
jgi:hypothetical protein